MEAVALSNVAKVNVYRKRARTQDTCHCNAYAFPHRAGGGLCNDPGEKPKSCDRCPHGKREYDPYGTGDRWYSIIECDGCYWD